MFLHIIYSFRNSLRYCITCYCVHIVFFYFIINKRYFVSKCDDFLFYFIFT